jgi:hypothetical protein
MALLLLSSVAWGQNTIKAKTSWQTSYYEDWSQYHESHCYPISHIVGWNWSPDTGSPYLKVITAPPFDIDGFEHDLDSTIARGRATFRDSLLKWYDDYRYSLTLEYIQEMKWWIKSGRRGDAPVDEEPTFAGFMFYMRTRK